MKKIMDVEKLNLITSITSNDMEIWVEVEGKRIPIRDYEWELEDKRIVLKA